MENVRLDKNKNFCHSMESADGSIIVDIEITGGKYIESVNGKVWREEAFYEPLLALFLMEVRIEELVKKGYVNYPTPFTIEPMAYEVSSVDAGKALAGILRKQENDLAKLILEQIESIEKGFGGSSDKEKKELSKLNSLKDISKSIEILDFEYSLGILANDCLYVWIDDRVDVSLTDAIYEVFPSEEIKQMQAAYNQFDCVHIAELRKLFHYPISQKLAFLTIWCSFSSIKQIFEILNEANALHIPIALHFTNPKNVQSPEKQNDSIARGANLQHLSCTIEYLEHFTNEFSSLKSLSIGSSGNEDEETLILDLLSNHKLDKLNYLQIHKVSGAEYLEQILNLPLIKQLSYFSLIEHPAYFPFGKFLDIRRNGKMSNEFILMDIQLNKALLTNLVIIHKLFFFPGKKQNRLVLSFLYPAGVMGCKINIL